MTMIFFMMILAYGNKKGERKPAHATLVRIAKALDISEKELEK